MSLNPGSSRGSTFHGCKVYNSAVQSIPNNTNTVVTFDSEEYDSDGYHSTASNTSRITIPVGLGGKYLFTFDSFWAANPNGASLASTNFKKNNATDIRAASSANPGGAGYLPTSSVICDLAETEYMEVIVYQNNGGAVNLGNNAAVNAQSAFTATKIG